jgi:nucleoid DNA-binding protein
MARADGKPLTKTQIINGLADKTELSKKDIIAVLDAMTAQIQDAVSSNGSGSYTVPGLCKIYVKDVPAKPRRQVRNPGTGEMVWADPKPASRAVKVRPLKALKDMA